MYQIFINPDGSCSCAGRLQDSTERWTEPTLEKAVASMKQFAKAMNHSKIKRRDITIYEQRQVVQWVERK